MQNCKFMFLAEATIDAVLQTAINFSNRSLDIDTMSMPFVKGILNYVVFPFTYICTLSFSTGVFPDAMKIAKVMPIYYDGEKKKNYNHRAIYYLHTSNSVSLPVRGIATIFVSIMQDIYIYIETRRIKHEPLHPRFYA